VFKQQPDDRFGQHDQQDGRNHIRKQQRADTLPEVPRNSE